MATDSSDDEVHVARASPSDSDDGVHVAGSGEFGAAAVVKRRKTLVTFGIFTAWLVCDLTLAQTELNSLIAAPLPKPDGAQCFVVGSARCKWAFSGTETDDEDIARLRHLACPSNSKPLGYIDYAVDQLCAFANPIPTNSDIRELDKYSLASVASSVARQMSASSQDAWTEWLSVNNRPACIASLPECLASLTYHSTIKHFRSTPIRQLLRYGGILTFPLRYQVRNWWQTLCHDEPDNVDDGNEQPSALDELPSHAEGEETRRGTVHPNMKSEIDPLKLIYAVAFGDKLKSQHLFTEAIEACYHYEFNDHIDVIDRDAADDPGATSLYMARLRLDVTSMLLQRREIRELAMHAERVLSIHVFSDGSPVVGSEIQGMSYQICYEDGSMESHTLPALSLPFGHYGLMDKTMALVWALFLCAGPQETSMRFFLNKVKSITTDFGTELKLANSPDMLRPFLHWMRGTPIEQLRESVSPTSRLMPRALRIGGWSHTMANIMKKGMYVCSEWPALLDSLRALCRFLGDESYRKHLVKMYKHVPELQVVTLFASSTASFAKWRYETIAVVIGCLDRYSNVTQHDLKRFFSSGMSKTGP